MAMAGNEAGTRLAALLERRQQLTDQLKEEPYDTILYLRRAAVYADLAYPDLAVGDAYRALLLTDELSDESFEYHELTYKAMGAYVNPDTNGELPDVLQGVAPAEIESEISQMLKSAETPGDDAGDDDDDDGNVGADYATCEKLAFVATIRCYQILALNLLLCGCLRSAHKFCERGLAADGSNKALLQTKSHIDTAARKRLRLAANGSYSQADLPDRGLVRREVYPWNTYEPDRVSAASLAFLNEQLAEAAPKCEVRATELPVLTEQGQDEDSTANTATCWQLGVFAKEPIAPGEAVLREYSLLTANNRHKDAACDACGSEIEIRAPTAKEKKHGRGEVQDVNDIVSCPMCDVVFCDADCHDRAQEAYHPAVCETDVDSIAKDPEDARDADDALYVLLLARLLAMSTHQECHPLEVKEVKYIWGDFVPPATNAKGSASGADLSLSASSPAVAAMAAAGGIPPAAWSLPFSFEANIATPLHIVEKMDLDVFEGLAEWDVWVLNTLYSKFRGTASARKSRRDGRPDVAAVHPLWCLANHDCDPNVTWEWGGRMVLWAKKERVQLAEDKAAGRVRPGGIAAGEEILNHYCDVDLPVQLRREWASGSLGGACMCQRCRNEAALEEKTT
ncbi:hypothetical protein SCUCBS95973_007509 [Sporothrix curviconia]|uniref:SET domain-containing protein n=1 Tax=Sporothrix curviconia TaxID=1260050 RepID=A0ABP0CDX1_9PEZI